MRSHWTPRAALPKKRVAGNLLPRTLQTGKHGFPKETRRSTGEPSTETRPMDSSERWNQDALAAALPGENVTNVLRIRRREYPATGAGPGFPKEEPRGGGWTLRTESDPWSTSKWGSSVLSVPKHRRRGAPEGGCGRLRPSSPPADPRGDRPAKIPARRRPWKALSGAAPKGRAEGETSSGPKRTWRGSVPDNSRRCGPRAAPERRYPVGTFGFVSTDLFTSTRVRAGVIGRAPVRPQCGKATAATATWRWSRGLDTEASRHRDDRDEESRQPSPADALPPSRRGGSLT